MLNLPKSVWHCTGPWFSKVLTDGGPPSMSIYLKIWNAIIYHFHVLSIKIIGYLCTGCPFCHVCQHGSSYGMSWQVQTLFAVMLLCTGTHWKGHCVSVCRKWYTAAMVSRLGEWGKRRKRSKTADVGKCSIQMTGTVIFLESLFFIPNFVIVFMGALTRNQFTVVFLF